MRMYFVDVFWLANIYYGLKANEANAWHDIMYKSIDKANKIKKKLKSKTQKNIEFCRIKNLIEIPIENILCFIKTNTKNLYFVYISSVIQSASICQCIFILSFVLKNMTNINFIYASKTIRSSEIKSHGHLALATMKNYSTYQTTRNKKKKPSINNK